MILDTISSKPSMNGEIAALLESKQGIRLDIGCGANKIGKTWVGMDIQDLPGVDIVHSWDEFPWPFPDESCIQILASHVVEHVSPANFHFIHWMNECWRVMRVGGTFAIIVPYANSHGYWQDPTHVNGCNETTWAYFDPTHESKLYNFYRPKPWKIMKLFWDVAANMEVILEKTEQ